MTDAATTLLTQLRRRGVEIAARGSRLHVKAPKGTVSEQDRATLAECKPDVLARLQVEGRLLGSSLDEFARQHYGIEVSVPWFDHTLWFVPTHASIASLLKQGVARGRIWTGKELTDLYSIDPLRPTDLVRVALLKIEFGLQILSIRNETPGRVGDD